jgi:6-phosphogluconolactonase/glucosamine-6-phosphate isomerase/deaminase
MSTVTFDPPTKLNFKPGSYVPFQDREICERLRLLTREQLEQHEPWQHPEFKVKVMMNPHPVLIATLFSRLKEASEAGRKFSMILGTPEPETYIPLAQLINYFQVDCSKVHIFAEDEWADDAGNIAPETYEAGFVHSMLKYLVYQIDPKFRMPMENVHYPTNKNISYYSKLINDVTEGGADIISTSPGWTGHVAFVDPIIEFVHDPDVLSGKKAPSKACIKAWLETKAQRVKLNPMTIMQNSLNGTFGQSGDISNVPPKAATIGPIDVMRAKERIEVHALATNGTFSSWQRMTSRLVTHGPVTPYVPSSMLQTKKTQVYISDELAAPFACWEKVGY